MPKKIKTVSAVVKPAVAEESFDEYALVNLSLRLNAKGKIVVDAKLAPAKTLQDGSRRVAQGLAVENIHIGDLEAAVVADPTGPVAVAYDAIVDAIVSLSDKAQAE